MPVLLCTFAACCLWRPLPLPCRRGKRCRTQLVSDCRVWRVPEQVEAVPHQRATSEVSQNIRRPTPCRFTGAHGLRCTCILSACHGGGGGGRDSRPQSLLAPYAIRLRCRRVRVISLAHTVKETNPKTNKFRARNLCSARSSAGRPKSIGQHLRVVKARLVLWDVEET